MTFNTTPNINKTFIIESENTFSITGFTFNGDILTLIDSNGASISTVINNFSGLTVDGVLSATTYYGDGSNLTGINNFYVTGGTINSNNILSLDRNDSLSAITIDLSQLIDDTNSYTTGSTLIGSTVYFDRNDSLSAYTLDLSGLDVNDTFITGGTYSGNTITLNRNDDVLIEITGITTDNFYVTGATIDSNNILSLDRNDTLSAVTVDLSQLIDDTNSYLTAHTFNNDTLTSTLNNGNSVSTTINTFNSVNTDRLNFNTNYTGSTIIEGSMFWDEMNQTVSLGLHNGDVSLQLGQETHYLIKNQTGSDILDGKVVRAVGTLGASGRILGDYMLADGSIPGKYTLGVSTNTILNGEDGYVTEFGLVRGIDTTGSLYGETWNDGDILWASPTIPGGLTNIEPVTPNLQIEIGIVVKAHNNGSIFVRPHRYPYAHDIQDFGWTGGTESNLDVVQWDSSLGYFKLTNTPNFNSLSATTIDSSIILSGTTNLVDIFSQTDTFITGGTYSGNTISLTRNDDIDILITGITTDNFYVTGATIDSNNILSLDRNDTLSAVTIDLSQLIDDTNTFITGVTFNDNTLTLTDNTNSSFNILIDNLSGLTVGGSISATTYYGDGSNLTGIVSPNIYGSNGTIGSGRVATLTDTLSFAGGRVSFDTTTNGILLPRLTTVQMNGISSPATNLLVYNTDLNGLYRYNGSSWVALSSGYGIIVVYSGSGNGTPTFFATLQSALETCKASGGYFTVKLYSNITITSSILIDYTGSGVGGAYLFRQLTIDLNGFSITNNQADTSHCFDLRPSNNVAVHQEIRFLNGNVIRTNGTGTHYALKFDQGGRFGTIQMSKMFWYCQNSNCANMNIASLSTQQGIDKVCDLGGSTFVSQNGYGIFVDNSTIRLKNFNVISHSANYALGANSGDISYFTAENTSTGRAISVAGTVKLRHFEGYSNSGNALYITNGIATNFYVRSVSGRAIEGDIAIACNISNFVAETGNNFALKLLAGFENNTNVTNGKCINNSATIQCVDVINFGYIHNIEATNLGAGVGLIAGSNQAGRMEVSGCKGISIGGIGGWLYAVGTGIVLNATLNEFCSRLNTSDGHALRVSGTGRVKLTHTNMLVRNSGANAINATSAVTVDSRYCTHNDVATTPINANVTIVSSGIIS